MYKLEFGMQWLWGRRVIKVLKSQHSKAIFNWVGMCKSNFSKLLLLQTQVSATIP